MGTSGSRERSTIQFPYGDLDDAVEVTLAIHQNAGQACSMSELAAYMNQTVTSGAFRTKVASARIFRLIEVTRQQVTLTELGARVVDPEQEAEARRDAFLAVPLYLRLYERYQGRVMPPDAGLENDMVGLGVAAKQKDKARQAFQRSADQGGFFQHGRNRLVAPKIFGSPRSEHPRREDAREASASGAAAETGGVTDAQTPHHELIKGLFRMLPTEGSFSKRQQERWLAAAKVNLALVYGADDASESEEDG